MRSVYKVLPYMYKISRDVIFVDFVVAWLSAKFRPQKLMTIMLAPCFLIGNIRGKGVILSTMKILKFGEKLYASKICMYTVLHKYLIS